MFVIVESDAIHDYLWYDLVVVQRQLADIASLIGEMSVNSACAKVSAHCINQIYFKERKMPTIRAKVFLPVLRDKLQ
jgi:hypothetical protein